MIRHYDAIVVGASFAGLAVARELSGEALLRCRGRCGRCPGHGWARSPS